MIIYWGFSRPKPYELLFCLTQKTNEKNSRKIIRHVDFSLFCLDYVIFIAVLEFVSIAMNFDMFLNNLFFLKKK